MQIKETYGYISAINKGINEYILQDKYISMHGLLSIHTDYRLARLRLSIANERFLKNVFVGELHVRILL